MLVDPTHKPYFVGPSENNQKLTKDIKKI